MNPGDNVVLVKMPPGDTAAKRMGLPLGQCGVIMEGLGGYRSRQSEPPLYQVNFGAMGTYWLGKDNLELMDDPPAEAVMLGGDFPPELVRRVAQDRHNEGALVTRGGAEALRQLAMLAIDVALEAPLDRASQPGYYCYINRDTVRAIRAILDDAGIPWKQQKKELKP